MNISAVIDLLVEFGLVLGTFAIGLVWAVWGGRQSVINIICAGYLALLFYQFFPYQERFVDQPFVLLCTYLGLSLVAFLFCRRIMPAPYLENRLESFGKKLLLGFAFSVFVIVISLQFLPLSDILGPQPTLLAFFADSTYSFWYLLLPLALVTLN